MAKKKQVKSKYGTKSKLVLSDNEVRDIVKNLEKGIPLDDKYRFLLFGDKREVELVWNGKSGEVSSIVLPFQTIEQVDEPRKEGSGGDKQITLMDFETDPRGRQLKGWTNKLIWGDNKLVLSSLKNGPLREEIEKQGGIKLIYIDPPFDVGADFSMKINIGDDEFTKQPNVLEELAYRDTWGKGADSFIAMMYERLMLMRDLLAPDGVIFVHCDNRVKAYMRLMLDEIFGKEKFRNEIIWHYFMGGKSKRFFAQKHDTILFYSKSDSWFFNEEVLETERILPYVPSLKSEKGIEEINCATCNKGCGIWKSKVKMDDVWDMSGVFNMSKEWIDYPTQKPEALIKRVIEACSKKDDIICDFFCGSGTTLAISEKIGRKWIGSDL